MKGKFLIYAGLLAAAVGCTKESLVSEGSKNDGGITFSASLAEGVATKGDVTYDNVNKFSWTAEWDRINVHSDAVVGAATNSSGKGVISEAAEWQSDLPAAAVYKATQSAGLGQFTAASDDDMLKFSTALNSGSNFVATYNATLNGVTLKKKADNSSIASPTQITALNLGLSLNLIDQKAGNYDETGAGYTAFFPMYSKTNATRETGKSVGEKMKLEFLRVLPGLAFSTTGVTPEMSTIFGSLTSITVTNKGTVDAEDDPKSDDVEGEGAHNLAFKNSASVLVDFTGENTTYDLTWPSDESDKSVEAKMTYSIADGIQTNFLDGKRAYMVVAPVERKGKTETVLITYEYKNITLKQVHKTNANWVVKPGNENGFYVIPAFDVAKEYPYLMVKNYGAPTPGATTEDYTLILNSGKLADTFSKTDEGVMWNGVPVEWEKIKAVVSNVELGSELSLLTKFTDLKELTLAKDTTIPAGTFTEKQAGQMITLDMPLVTSIDKKFTAAAFSKLKTLKLASYTFTDEAVNSLLNMNTPKIDNVDNPLAVIDMRAVEDMMPTFGVERSLSFKDYKQLTTVTVKDGVHLSPSAFSGCTSLKTVNGVVDITDAVSAFENTSSLGKDARGQFTGVLKINGTVIPESAFKGSSIKNIYKDNKQVVPTSIGTSAFEGATGIEMMDLSAATEIGADAFREASNFIGAASGKIFTVGATKILGGTFALTSLDGAMIEFSNATYIEPGILYGVIGQIKQIKFAKVLKDLPTENDYKANNVNNRKYTWANTFSDKSGNIDLFMSPAQTEYVSGTSLVFVKAAATENTTAVTVQVKFKSLQKK